MVPGEFLGAWPNVGRINQLTPNSHRFASRLSAPLLFVLPHRVSLVHRISLDDWADDGLGNLRGSHKLSGL